MGSGSGRGHGEPASSRRFFDIFMQSEVGREGGKKGRVGGRKRMVWREGMREVIVTSSKLLSHRLQYQW